MQASTEPFPEEFTVSVRRAPDHPVYQFATIEMGILVDPILSVGARWLMAVLSSERTDVGDMEALVKAAGVPEADVESWIAELVDAGMVGVSE